MLFPENYISLNKPTKPMEIQIIQSKIHLLRGQRVMLDYDLAELFDVSTKILKQAVRRNINRFPDDFMFELTAEEMILLRSQIVTSKRGGTRYSPFAFTEHGVTMLASILHSDRAIQVNIQVVRAFVALRQMAHSIEQLADKILELEARWGKEIADIHEVLTWLGAENQARANDIAQITQEANPWENRRQIGFQRED